MSADNTLLPKMPDTRQLVASYKPAYIVPVFDVGDNNVAVPFVLNVDDTIAGIDSAEDWDSKSLNASDFWLLIEDEDAISYPGLDD